MSNTGKSESVNYGTRIPAEEAEQIEDYRYREGMNKSEAIRELTLTGLEQKDRHARFFERAALLMVSVSLAGAFAALVSAVVVYLAGIAGFIAGIKPGAILAVGGVTLLVLVATAGVGWACHVTGVAAWIDEWINRTAARLEAGA